jgi:hypothetical protein
MQQGAQFGPGGEYEKVGVVAIGADEGTDAMSEDIRKLVRPRACAMGGEVISLQGSGSGANHWGRAQQNIFFGVWAKQNQASASPQKF